jgi:hypothetical protein
MVHHQAIPIFWKSKSIDLAIEDRGNHMTKGIVYVLTNEAMPGLVKIGYTTDLKERIKKLSQPSGIPAPFECFFAVEVENPQEVEKKIHDGLHGARKNLSREFFEIAPERVKSLMQLPEHRVVLLTEVSDSGTTPTSNIENGATSRRLSLTAAGLSIGDKLVFTRDNQVSVVVKNSSSVQFGEEQMTLAQATKIALRQIGESWSAGAAADYWLFGEDLLAEIISRIDPKWSRNAFSIAAVFPVIAESIIFINNEMKIYASHSAIVDALLENDESIRLIDTAEMLTRFTSRRDIASNMVAWWSQQITVGLNPFKDQFQRRNTPYEYWAVSLGTSPD